jgi:hypothetical protein
MSSQKDIMLRKEGIDKAKNSYISRRRMTANTFSIFLIARKKVKSRHGAWHGKNTVVSGYLFLAIFFIFF